MQWTLGIGLLGCGTVGTAVAERLLTESDALERRSGVRFTLRGIAVRDTAKPRTAAIPHSLLTSDPHALIDDPLVDLLIECIGGTTDAAELIERALDRGRHVVTANKDLLATQGPRLRALADARRVTMRYEAAVCGAVPIVRMLDEALAGDRTHALAGVVNGTCTYVLSAMEGGAEFEEALAKAQQLGFAEADPAYDVDGTDATHKLAVLVQLAFGLAVISPRIRHRGITGITRADVQFADRLGFRIRLLAAARATSTGVAAEVAPVLVPREHPFARARGAENAVHVEARDAGSLLLHGVGAGGRATASAVLGDAVSALRAIGERHDLTYRAQRHSLAPAFEVLPLFSELRSHAKLPRYRVWDERCLKPLTDAPASSEPDALIAGKG